MNITDILIKTIEKEGIILADRQDVYNSLDKAIQLGQFEFIMIDGKNVGFFSWELQKPMEIYINNLFIERKYRRTFSLMRGIRFIRAKYEGLGAISWKNRKKNKPVRFSQRMSLCCSQS